VTSGPRVEELVPGSAGLASALRLADELGQRKYLERAYPSTDRTILLGALAGDEAVGFLLLLLQVIGREEGRPPLLVDEAPLREGYVNAFGVAEAHRRRGTGKRMQRVAISICEREGCYQMRSRSPTSAVENYALKLDMGYTVHPSSENDSYFFLKKLRSGAGGGEAP